MDAPDPLQNPQQLALQLSQDLAVLRDAMVRLSLAVQDYVFEYSGKDDPTTALETQRAIERAKR